MEEDPGVAQLTVRGLSREVTLLLTGVGGPHSVLGLRPFRGLMGVKDWPRGCVGFHPSDWWLALANRGLATGAVPSLNKVTPLW